jgi:hypothetical protein
MIFPHEKKGMIHSCFLHLSTFEPLNFEQQQHLGIDVCALQAVCGLGLTPF